MKTKRLQLNKDMQAGLITAGNTTEDTGRVIEDGDIIQVVVMPSGEELFFDDKDAAKEFLEENE